MKVPFSPPDISEPEINEVAAALRSGWITTGPRTKKLEESVAAFTGSPRAVCLNSATACMELTLRLLGVGPGDEVITSAYTYTATAAVIDHVGARIVLIDTNGSNFEMDYDQMEQAINERTKVVIPVDLGGRMCDYERIYQAVESKKALFRPNSDIQKAFGRVIVMADAAHAFGASRCGHRAGEAADFTCFSFHAVKNFTTAEGGAVTWRDHEGVDNEGLYREYQLASLHGQNKDALAKTRIGAWEYDIVYPAYKCNMTDVAAAIGLGQMDRYPALLARRREIIEKYDEALRPMGLWTLRHYEEGIRSTGHLYITRVPGADADRRNALIDRMGERGIACNVHYKPLPMMTAYKRLGFDISDYPRAFAMYENEITLPLHTRLTDEQVDYVIDNFKEILNGAKLG